MNIKDLLLRILRGALEALRTLHRLYRRRAHRWLIHLQPAERKEMATSCQNRACGELLARMEADKPWAQAATPAELEYLYLKLLRRFCRRTVRQLEPASERYVQEEGRRRQRERIRRELASSARPDGEGRPFEERMETQDAAVATYNLGAALRHSADQLEPVRERPAQFMRALAENWERHYKGVCTLLYDFDDKKRSLLHNRHREWLMKRLDISDSNEKFLMNTVRNLCHPNGKLKNPPKA